MIVRFWTSKLGDPAEDSPVATFVRDLQTLDAELWALVDRELRRVARPDVILKEFEDRKWAERMSYVDCPLYEFRFPPKRQRGVARIYFCFDPVVRNQIWLLAAERKNRKEKNKKKLQHSAVVDTAEARCKVIRSREGM